MPTKRLQKFVNVPFLIVRIQQNEAKNLAMSRATFFKYWKVLEKTGAVKVTRQIGRATLYEPDKQNDIVRQLIKLDIALARKSMDKTVQRSKEVDVLHLSHA